MSKKVKSKKKKTSQTDIISYPFGGGAGKSRSQYAPAIIESVMGEHLAGSYNKWKMVKIDDTIPVVEKYDLKNYMQVEDAVFNLAMEIADSQWHGKKSLALGGGHTQGIATLHATKLISVLKAILDGSIPTSEAFRMDLNLYATESSWQKVAEIIDAEIEENNSFANHVKKVTDNIVILWVDTHADYNTKDISPSGNTHGMSLAAGVGRDVGGLDSMLGRKFHMNPKNAYVIGARDLDAAERALMEKDGVHFQEFELTQDSPNLRVVGDHTSQKPTLKDAIQKVMDANPGKKFIVSFDVDVIHGREVAATGTPMGLEMVDAPEELQGREDVFIRKNENGESPAGPSSIHAYRALHGLAHHPDVLAIDLTEASSAVGEIGDPFLEKTPGRTINTTCKALKAILTPPDQPLTNGLALTLDQSKSARKLTGALNQMSEAEQALTGKSLRDGLDLVLANEIEVYGSKAV